MTEQPRTAAVAGALRDAWHAATRPGDPSTCPGCPACRAVDALAGVPPETIGHVESALGHLAAAGRELVAALAAADAFRGEAHQEPTDDGASADDSAEPGAAAEAESGARTEPGAGAGPGAAASRAEPSARAESGAGAASGAGAGAGAGPGAAASRRARAPEARPARVPGHSPARERIEITGEATPPAARPDDEERG